VWIEDLGATNATQLNGAPVRRAPVQPGDEVTMGGLVAAVHVAALPSRGPALLNHERFLAALDAEAVRCRLFARAAAVVMLEGTDVQRADEVFARLRAVDQLGVYSDNTLELLLPEAAAEEAQESAGALVSDGLASRAGLALIPEHGISAAELVAVSRGALQQAAAGRVSLARSQRAPRPAADPSGVIWGRSPAMLELRDTIDRLASSQIPVLVMGETGAGKEVLARMIHAGSPRRSAPLVCVNCGAIPASILESTLFGHERGAFTGATQSVKGIFEEAHGGTLLLDEIGELPMPAQAALLRVLETRRLTRVGSTREIPADVRIIAATNRDLEAMCTSGQFRQDLYFRLNALSLILPPLRERLEEIPPLVELFIRQANEANGRAVRGVDDRALRLLCRYPWPGNIRELRNAIERATVIARGSLLTPADLPVPVRSLAGLAAGERPAGSEAQGSEGAAPEGAPGPEQATAPEASLDLNARVRQLERDLVMEALRRSGGDRAAASRLLGIPPRTLSHKIERLGLRKGYSVAED
jgi:DNA-binding NtrC family response regulator